MLAKFKELERNSIHEYGNSYEFVIFSYKKMKIRFIYKAGNSFESCNSDIFDTKSLKWNSLTTMRDLGINPDNSAYNLLNAQERQKRAIDLFSKTQTLIQKIL